MRSMRGYTHTHTHTHIYIHTNMHMQASRQTNSSAWPRTVTRKETRNQHSMRNNSHSCTCVHQVQHTGLSSPYIEALLESTLRSFQMRRNEKAKPLYRIPVSSRVFFAIFVHHDGLFPGLQTHRLSVFISSLVLYIDCGSCSHPGRVVYLRYSYSFASHGLQRQHKKKASKINEQLDTESLLFGGP